MVKRLLKHLFVPPWTARTAFPPSALKQIEAAIKASEKRHRGELRFAVEGPLSPLHMRTSARERARQLFAALNVWDTEENTGVLIYVQLVDRAIEVVADRGIAARVAQPEWDALCRTMERRFRDRDYLAGALEAIEGATRLLERHFPARDANPNELPDKPVVL